MKRKTTLWFFLALVVLVCVGCSTDNSISGNGQAEAVKPPPQMRVVALPSATATLALPEQALAPTLEPTATSAQIYTWATPDEDAIVSQIDAMMAEIDRKLNSQDLILKP